MANRVRYTKDRKKEFLEALEKTANVSQAAREAGGGRRAWYRVKEADLEFSDAWDAAVEVATDALETEARRRAVSGVLEPVYYQGKKCGAIRKYSDTLLIFLLKGHRPKKYADFHRVEGGGAPIRIEIVKFADVEVENREGKRTSDDKVA